MIHVRARASWAVGLSFSNPASHRSHNISDSSLGPSLAASAAAPGALSSDTALIKPTLSPPLFPEESFLPFTLSPRPQSTEDTQQQPQHRTTQALKICLSLMIQVLQDTLIPRVGGNATSQRCCCDRGRAECRLGPEVESIPISGTISALYLHGNQSSTGMGP